MAVKFVRSLNSSTKSKGAVELVADYAPASLTMTGADVIGLSDDFILSAGSTLRTPEKNYVAFTDGIFTEVSGGGSSGTNAGTFVVNVTPPVDQGDPHTTDKGFDEILAAITSGRRVVARVPMGNGYVLDVPAFGFSEEYITFQATTMQGRGSQAVGVIIYASMETEYDYVLGVEQRTFTLN